VGIGDVHMTRRDYARAEPAYARAARLSPNDFQAHYGRGLALQMLDRLEEAAKAYYGALVVQPANFNANANLATVYLQMDQPRSAVIFAQKAVEIDPTHGPSRANLGTAYEKIGRFSDAAKQYTAAVELLDDATPVMMSLMRALGQEGRYREAAETGERLVKMAPSAIAYERLGWCYFRLGQPDRSINAYRSAIEIDPDHWPALNGVGTNALNTWLLSGKNDRAAADEARRALRRSLQINPEQPRIVVLLSSYGL
jgi:tetratricopeptide (TPR) repeat protein